MVFTAFTKAVNSLPPDAIIRALDMQCEMVEKDFQERRSTLNEDALSILCFKQFIRMARTGEVMTCAKHLPAHHLEFYRETIVRLVQAHELRASAMEQFERAFSPGCDTATP